MIEDLVKKLRLDYPEFSFASGARFAWDPKTKTIHYHIAKQPSLQDKWTLIHELSHALLGHQDFSSDMQLLQMEVSAWHKAAELAPSYDLEIDSNYVEDCLDSYRDWLHSRATCPTCLERCLQTDQHTYACHNCRTSWHVTKSRLCRTYRLKK